MNLESFYWASTVLLSLLYLSSAAIYLAKGAWVRQALAELNYPAPYLVPLMVVVKIAAPVVILLRLSPALSDLAYAGILFHMLLSGSAHLGVRKPAGAIPAMIGLLLLCLSFATQNAAREAPSPYAPQIQAASQ
ncbi:DoxX family protein [Poseidonocella sp. HB161398]|uniref:DoxX family protein n=1 Tax=Poseidonocella sp. HB161398 TaxID=2320855 RepID=UPI00110909DC|nr:DoxX family protein [Poseidonocella sp. HB161398]